MVLSGLTIQRAVLRTVFPLLILVSLATAQPGNVTGTMPEDYLPDLKAILATALQRSPDTIAKEFERMVAEARIYEANASRLPHVDGNFNYGITQTATASNASTQTRDSGFFYSFGVSQALFHWKALKNQSDIAKINLLVQEKSFILAYRELSVTLRKAYLALIVDKIRVQQLRESLRLQAEDVGIATAKKETGSLSAAALEGEKLRLRESTLEVNRVEAEFTANRRRFARLAGLPDLPEEKIPMDIPPPVYSESQATAMAAAVLRDNAKSTLEFEIYNMKVHAAELQQKIEATRLLPKFGANANYSLQNTTNVNGVIAEQRAVATQTIGIGGSWTIFDGLYTRGAKREALAARRALEQQRTVTVEQLLQNTQALERALKLDAEQLELSDIRHGLAVEGHRRIVEEVSFGKLPKGDIDRAKIGILQADAKTAEVRAAYLSRWSEFVALAGDDPVLNNIPARYARAKK